MKLFLMNSPNSLLVVMGSIWEFLKVTGSVWILLGVPAGSVWMLFGVPLGSVSLRSGISVELWLEETDSLKGVELVKLCDCIFQSLFFLSRILIKNSGVSKVCVFSAISCAKERKHKKRVIIYYVIYSRWRIFNF